MISAVYLALIFYEEEMTGRLYVYFAKKSAFFFSRLVLISSFCAAFSGQHFGKIIWLILCQLDWTQKLEIYF